ncbi:ArpU family phage packaging/lysis transcriptional regulator [Melissococcus plutonius]|uniref:ArpU family phage packaging/lysis transcriptional regulator n=2 Tax=Melissococcus plutonius TaxID=33970 RepID=UPI0021E5963D|nr:ArpU family phage packaging/lysis transcriptional regulator [Melissococcus plutonius]MCV2498227.1 autolysin [Melissococcus plutonius]MCV2506842.1 autolysin [Melissococcus plutonius]MCV2528072.1 autolysin [Melissococcus plutonius]
MELLLKVDQIETKKNARLVLKQYRRWQRIAGRPAIDIKSPIITDMPKNDSVFNQVEKRVIERVNAKVERDKIVRALVALSVVNRQILYFTYCDVEKRSNLWIGNAIGFSDKNIEKLKSRALLEFAEAYQGGILVALKK